MRHRMVGIVVAMLVGLVAAACGKSTTSGSGSTPSGGTKASVTVGSNSFAESEIMAQMYGQVLAHAGYQVNYKMDVGARQVLQAAMPGQIQVAPEYVGSLLTVYLHGTGSSDPAKELADDNTALAPKNLTLVGYSPAADQNTFVVTKATADKYHLSTISDLKKVTDKLTLAGPPECQSSALCLGGLQSTYGLSLTFQALGSGCDNPPAQALEAGQVNIAELCTTQSVIAKDNLVQLKDDKNLQQADNITAEVGTALLNANPGIKGLLTGVMNKLTSDALASLDDEVSVGHKDASSVATTWLKQNGLL
ncbi:MAG TPA: ABC transporter substrate-binding protein [Actinomycetota bacterium]|nr:ABC transporter substrate-binding protein [Actinomycetota bacterium]